MKSKKYKKLQSNIGKFSLKIADFKSYYTDYEKLITEIDLLINIISQFDWNKDQGI